MIIATWNIERLKHSKRSNEIISICNDLGADVLVLTETDERIRPNYNYSILTEQLDGNGGVLYKPTERRVSICTNYPCVHKYPTYDEKTSLCVELATPYGPLIVYGTIIGVFGNRHPSYQEDLSKTFSDIASLPHGTNICLCGDFNCSFSDNYYFTHQGRDVLLEGLAERNMEILTSEQPECIDHIALTRSLVCDHTVKVNEWNHNKRLSDQGYYGLL